MIGSTKKLKKKLLSKVSNNNNKQNAQIFHLKIKLHIKRVTENTKEKIKQNINPIYHIDKSVIVKIINKKYFLLIILTINKKSNNAIM
jgi:hypothetical protein